MSHASQLRAVRAYFGFSQPALAPWLGLSRALLASVETGREQLPAHARRWLRPWVEALTVPEPAPAVPPGPTEAGLLAPPTTGPALVRARMAECDYQARRLGQQLSQLLAGHRIARRRLAAAPLLLATLPPPAPTPEPEALARRRRWLARLLEAATDALQPEHPSGPVAAVLLAARRQAWRHEAGLLHAWLQEVARNL